MVVIESKISTKLQNHVLKGDFKNIEIFIILNRQIRTIVNLQKTDYKHKPFQFGLVDIE